jgi:DNA polymerase-3 subunit gamma/tau
MVGHHSKKAAAFAREAVVREIEGQTLILVFKHKIHADGVNNEPGPLLDAVHQTLGGVWSVRCEVGGDGRKAAPPAAPAARPKPAPAATEDWPTTARTGPAASARPAGTQTEAQPQDEEVPYDPEFDGPPPPALQGFDPGDEPDHDTDSLAVKQTSEQQALESLRKSFNIEKIAEQGR